MRKITVVLCLFSVFYRGQTQQVTKEFNRVLLDDEFARIDGKWNQQSNTDNFFIGSTEGFETWRKNTRSGFFIFPEKQQEFSVFEVQLTFNFASGGSNNQSAGLVMQAQPDGSGALIIELNRKKQFRIRRAVANMLINVTGEGEGWLKGKQFITSGQNTLTIRTYDKIYDIFINDKYVRSFTEIEYAKGWIGLYIGPGSKAVFKRITVKTDEDHVNPDLNSNTPVDEQKALAQAIVKLKETINKKDKRIAELEAQIRTQPVGGRRDSTLQRQLEEANQRSSSLESELDALKDENERLKASVARLEAFRKSISESENGDVIINLTNTNLRQKEQIEQLQASLRAQEKMAEQLRQEKAELNNKIAEARTEVDEQRNQALALQMRLIEKDSIILAEEEKLKMMDEALTECSKNRRAPRKEKAPADTDAEKPRKRKKVKTETPLFDE